MGWLTERRRRRLLEEPFPAAWLEILERNVAAYALLDEGEQQRLRELTQVFVAEKHWEGCGGLELTDEIRVTIAGSGCQLVLAWDAALHGARDPSDGSNVVIHELAHKIDVLDGRADGTPPLPSRDARRAWAKAFEPAFLAHRERAERGEPSLLSDYAITNEAEYFAVATEMFFERPRALADELPEVYDQLKDFFRLDLAARVR